MNGAAAAPATAVPGRHRPPGRPPCVTRDRPARAGASIRAVTTTLTISTSAPRSIDADAVVIGVIKGQDGPVLAPGAADLDEALGGGLAATLATLGATGQAEEVTRLPGGAPVTAPLIAAVGLGPGPEARTRGRLAGPRDAAPRGRRGGQDADRGQPDGASQAGANGDRADLRIALALPAADPARPRPSRSARCWAATRSPGTGSEAARPAAITVLTSADDADGIRRRAQALADAVSLARDLVNTAPSDLVPATLADEAERVAAAAGLQRRGAGREGARARRLRRHRGRRPGLGAPAAAGPDGVRAGAGGHRRWCSSARASRSTPAGSR